MHAHDISQACSIFILFSRATLHIASANDIIQKNADGYWDRVFDADANTDLSDSSFTAVQYVTNLTTGVQFKWLPDSGFWVKSYEGFYEPGTWSIEF